MTNDLRSARTDCSGAARAQSSASPHARARPPPQRNRRPRGRADHSTGTDLATHPSACPSVLCSTGHGAGRAASGSEGGTPSRSAGVPPFAFDRPLPDDDDEAPEPRDGCECGEAKGVGLRVGVLTVYSFGAVACRVCSRYVKGYGSPARRCDKCYRPAVWPPARFHPVPCVL